MKLCDEIKRRIDEADDAESLDFDITRHTAACDGCRRFAGERGALRELLASTSRVTAPVNFDAVLHARLAEVKSRRPLAWLNAAFYLRAGAATAALVVAVFAAQYGGLFNAAPTAQNPPQGATEQAAALAPKTNESTTPGVGQSTPASLDQATPAQTVAARSEANVYAANVSPARRARLVSAGSRRNAGVPLVTREEAGMVDGGAIFIPGRNGEHDVTVPTVSVGAQPLIYVNQSRQPQAARAVSVSF